MPNSRHISVIGSPSSSRATKRRRSSITELSFHGINTSRPKAKSVTHVSGTKCHLCLRLLSIDCEGFETGPSGLAGATCRSLRSLLRNVSAGDHECSATLGEDARALKRFKLSSHCFTSRADTSGKFSVRRDGPHH